jgi:hypothetical protein
MAELLGDHLLIPEEERADFLRMARGEYVAAMPSPIAAVPFPAVPLEDETFSQEHETLFVAREGELAQLGSFLDLALTGQGQVVFVPKSEGPIWLSPAGTAMPIPGSAIHTYPFAKS